MSGPWYHTACDENALDWQLSAVYWVLHKGARNIHTHRDTYCLPMSCCQVNGQLKHAHAHTRTHTQSLSLSLSLSLSSHGSAAATQMG